MENVKRTEYLHIVCLFSLFKIYLLNGIAGKDGKSMLHKANIDSNKWIFLLETDSGGSPTFHLFNSEL